MMILRGNTIQITRLSPPPYIYPPPFNPFPPTNIQIGLRLALLNSKMGNCSASSSAQVATAKLVLHDGRLQEFSHPVKASYVLQKYPMCFICNSDDMDFDDVVTAIDENEELQLGQLYFVLPLTRLDHRLRAEEMAALAVKASSALTKSSGGGKYVSDRKQIVFSGEETKRSNKRVSAGVNSSDKTRRGRSRGNFTAILSAIPEQG